MERKWKSSMFLSGALLLGAIALSGTTAMADVTMQVTGTLTSNIVETVDTEMNFGSIEILPGGDVITIAAGGAGSGAGGAAAIPVSTGTSVVTGSGTSGLITISSPITLQVDVIYPASVDITDGTTTVQLTAIDANSGGGTTDGTITHAALGTTNIHVGGVITFLANATTGNYAGTIPIEINYN